jgi:mannose-1-phosphate guanylyltransferase/phosphomannomutase
VQAVIMAGGRGERLRPLTALVPKPLVPLFGRPLLVHLLAQMRGWGVDEAIVTLGYGAPAIREALETADHSVRLRFLEEERPLGTAGSVRQALPLLEETFLVLSGDGLIDVDLLALVDHHRRERNAVTMCLARPDSGLQFGLVDRDDAGAVQRFVEKPRFADVFPGQGLNTGVYVLERRALAVVPDGEAWDFSRDLFPHLLERGERIGGHFATRYWRDVGTVPSYLEAHWDVLSGRVHLSSAELSLVQPGEFGGDARVVPPVSIAPGAAIGTGVVLTGPLVVGPGARLDAGVHLSHAVLWDDVHVGHGARLAHLVVTSHARVPPGSHLHGGVVLGRAGRLT